MNINQIVDIIVREKINEIYAGGLGHFVEGPKHALCALIMSLFGPSNPKKNLGRAIRDVWKGTGIRPLSEEEAKRLITVKDELDPVWFIGNVVKIGAELGNSWEDCKFDRTNIILFDLSEQYKCDYWIAFISNTIMANKIKDYIGDRPLFMQIVGGLCRSEEDSRPILITTLTNLLRL